MKQRYLGALELHKELHKSFWPKGAGTSVGLTQVQSMVVPLLSMPCTCCMNTHSESFFQLVLIQNGIRNLAISYRIMNSEFTNHASKWIQRAWFKYILPAFGSSDSRKCQLRRVSSLYRWSVIVPTRLLSIPVHWGDAACCFQILFSPLTCWIPSYGYWCFKRYNPE